MNIVKTPNTSDNDYYVITITGDSNDADYITTDTCLSEKSFNEAIPALEYLFLNCIGKHKLEDYYDNHSDDIDLDEYFDIPFGEMGACHTIKDVSIKFFEKTGMSYNVTFE